MATTVERTPDGIIYNPAEVRHVPDIDLMTLLFESETCRVPEDKVIHADAAEPSHNLTKGRLRQLSQRAAHVFRHQYGIGAQGENKDVVFMISTGHFMTPLIFYGAIMAGGIFSSTNPSATPGELAYQLRQTSATVVVCTPDTKDVVLAAAKKAGLSERNMLLFGGTKDLEFKEAASGARVPISNQELQWRRITDPVELDNSVICLLFSSGTTGLPKAMPISHRNSVAHCALAQEPTREYNKATKPLGYEYRMIAHLPTAHVAGVQVYLVNNCYVGGCCYWMSRFDFPKFCEYAKKYQATTMFTVPPIYLLIAKSSLVKDHFDTWQEAIAGAAPMGPDLEVEVAKKLGKGATKLRQTWGLSETCGTFTISPIDPAQSAPPGSVGALIANCYARLIDDNDKDVDPGQPGEVWAKGPVVTNGYWRNDKANKESFKDGWFCTGDIAVFKDGFFFIVDRKKELIKYKGNQVAPAELEAMLLSHPKILDAAVIGVPGDGTEVPRAYVVADQKQITGQEIMDWFKKQGLSHYKQLRGGVVFLEAIPKSPSGKILRKILRDMAKNETPLAKI
ncbi:Uu.00g011450.m01.CDS01 [Anthostomella pinea]|uniref:Uu.00g011450.m01.CDS01 n=1 Tax=Anthostomella pinea TaxID=933095 RepID=A0AAI8YQ75_9PEZI|nr:Uu.00g011450.m01.CDS01 [Anthostomella pinea]